MKHHTLTAPRRIFWLGMHKILTTTELPRLRTLGYEVFNPPYLSDVYDQSANLDWNKKQPTTLPREVFETLSRYNFFYNQVSPEIAELLNTYFDVAIVTINPQWLAAVLRVFHKKVIYRTYGQTYQICAHLIGERVWKNIAENPQFHFVPFAEETLTGEHQWLTDRCSIIPYALPDDVYKYEHTWNRTLHIDEVMTSVPNINNSYYRAMYDRLNHTLPDNHLRMYGVQAEKVNDVRVAGTLPRAEVLRAYQRAAGYFYPYQDPHVCYLPPVEMMTIGGPVVYTSGSLLHRFFKGRTPGLAYSIDDQKLGIQRLRRGDRVYVREILASQSDVVRRYHPDYVYPIFDTVMNELLGDTVNHPAVDFSTALMTLAGTAQSAKEVWLLCHWPGQLIHESASSGAMFAADGISRVILKVIDALLQSTDYHLVLTCYAQQAPLVTSYYFPHLKNGRISLYILDPNNLQTVRDGAMAESWGSVFSFLIRRHFPAESQEEQRLNAAGDQIAGRMNLAAEINARPAIASVFVPHYYHFPEALHLRKGIVAYIPDFMPHFYPGVAFEGTAGRDKENAVVGRALAKQARIVMTQSMFTADYLPQSALDVDPGKIRTLPMPLLTGQLRGDHSGGPQLC